MAKNPRITKVNPASTLAVGPEAAKAERIYKSITDYPKERREFVLSETVVHPKVQKRQANVDATLGAIPAMVEEIFDKLNEGHITIERLIARDPIVIAGVKNEQGEVVQYARVDGHTRIPAIIRYLGNTAKVQVEYFECTERELYILSGSVNADNATPLSRNERIAMFTDYLNDKELVQLSDSALAELMAGQQQSRNIGNLRRSLIVKVTKDLVKKGQRFEETLMTQIKKYAPRIRKGLDGREIDTSKIGGDMFESLKVDPAFDDIRPSEEPAEETAEQPKAKPTAAAPAPAPTQAATPDKTDTFVPPVGKLDEVSTPIATDADGAPVADAPITAENEPTTDQPAHAAAISTHEFNADGYIATIDNVEFATGSDGAMIQIRTATGAVTITANALFQFAEQLKQHTHAASVANVAE